MASRVVVAGGGIGGLAAALALLCRGAAVQLFERANAFGEAGAGIQMGPNATRRLHAWGLESPLRAVAAFPQRLVVRSADSGAQLAALRLGAAAQQRYGAPYATIHRADLHGLLLHAVRQHDAADLQVGREVLALEQSAHAVRVQTSDQQWHTGDLLVGADGLWSRVRQCLLDDVAPRFTGHLAFRSLCPQLNLPLSLRSQDIVVWLGVGLHLVQYPVRGGESLNLVAVVQADLPGETAGDVHALQNWDHGTDAVPLYAALTGCAPALQNLVRAMDNWRLWPLCDRSAMAGPQEHGRGRVVLLGDAAHPMRPYLAQGAGMAIEDAAELAQQLGASGSDAAVAALRYAKVRWQRNRRVQLRAERNSWVFHAKGLTRLGRDMALRVFGARLLDMPWLYRG